MLRRPRTDQAGHDQRVVDRLIGEQEIVIKTVGNYIGEVRGISGATILGDGTVSLIIDAAALLDKVTEEQRLALPVGAE